LTKKYGGPIRIDSSQKPRDRGRGSLGRREASIPDEERGKSTNVEKGRGGPPWWPSRPDGQRYEARARDTDFFTERGAAMKDLLHAKKTSLPHQAPSYGGWKVKIGEKKGGMQGDTTNPAGMRGPSLQKKSIRGFSSLTGGDRSPTSGPCGKKGRAGTASL